MTQTGTYYGHKIFLAAAASGLILDCAIPKGNPADSTWTAPMVRRQGTLFGRPPRQASFDGGFASADNLAAHVELRGLVATEFRAGFRPLLSRITCRCASGMAARRMMR